MITWQLAKQAGCPALKPKPQLNGTRLDAVLQELTSSVATHRGQIVYADTAFAAKKISSETRQKLKRTTEEVDKLMILEGFVKITLGGHNACQKRGSSRRACIHVNLAMQSKNVERGLIDCVGWRNNGPNCRCEKTGEDQVGFNINQLGPVLKAYAKEVQGVLLAEMRRRYQPGPSQPEHLVISNDSKALMAFHDKRVSIVAKKLHGEDFMAKGKQAAEDMHVEWFKTAMTHRAQKAKLNRAIKAERAAEASDFVDEVLADAAASSTANIPGPVIVSKIDEDGAAACGLVTADNSDDDDMDCSEVFSVDTDESEDEEMQDETAGFNEAAVRQQFSIHATNWENMQCDHSLWLPNEVVSRHTKAEADAGKRIGYHWQRDLMAEDHHGFLYAVGSNPDVPLKELTKEGRRLLQLRGFMRGTVNEAFGPIPRIADAVSTGNMSSAHVETMGSAANDIMTNQRESMDPDALDSAVTVRANRGVLGHLKQHFPELWSNNPLANVKVEAPSEVKVERQALARKQGKVNGKAPRSTRTSRNKRGLAVDRPPTASKFTSDRYHAIPVCCGKPQHLKQP